MNLSSAIKSIQDIMRKDDGVDGDAQRIGQLTWMLFLKVFDQRREAQLRRAGWKFWRISGSAFYRNKEKALDGL